MYRILSFTVVCLTVLFLYSCHSHTGESADGHTHAGESADEVHAHALDEIVFTPEQARRAGLQVETVVPSDFAEVLEVSGSILPAQGSESTVTATMSGIVRLTGVRLTDGVQVSEGATLFRIDAAPLADGNPVAIAQAELTAARTALERAEKLAAERIISQRELEDAQRRYTAAEAAARSLGDGKRIRNVVSPLTGYIKDLLVRDGDYVSEGQPLLTVTQNRRLQLQADVPERYYSHLPQIRSARFRMAYDTSRQIYSLDELNGRLVSRGQSVKSGDYFVPVTFEFNNQGALVPGSLVQVYLLGNVRSEVISVPVEALAEGQGLHFVYLQLSDHTYRRQEVKTGASDGRRVEILAGLRPGERIVTRGTTQVKLAANASVAPEGHKH